MAEATEQDDVQYQFTVDREMWTKWKDTVPRSKALRDRIAELLKEDLEEHQ